MSASADWDRVRDLFHRALDLPAVERAVFVRMRAPHCRLSSGGVSQAVIAAASRVGLGKVSGHRLRHTLATQMVRSGVALPEVAQVLRHRRLATSAIYAKVDRESLRLLARPWPGGAR